ncbi:unnamed protein product, partial [Prorocentrum cordatum]
MGYPVGYAIVDAGSAGCMGGANPIAHLQQQVLATIESDEIKYDENVEIIFTYANKTKGKSLGAAGVPHPLAMKARGDCLWFALVPTASPTLLGLDCLKAAEADVTHDGFLVRSDGHREKLMALPIGRWGLPLLWRQLRRELQVEFPDRATILTFAATPSTTFPNNTDATALSLCTIPVNELFRDKEFTGDLNEDLCKAGDIQGGLDKDLDWAREFKGAPNVNLDPALKPKRRCPLETSIQALAPCEACLDDPIWLAIESSAEEGCPLSTPPPAAASFGPVGPASAPSAATPGTAREYFASACEQSVGQPAYANKRVDFSQLGPDWEIADPTAAEVYNRWKAQGRVGCVGPSKPMAATSRAAADTSATPATADATSSSKEMKGGIQCIGDSLSASFATLRDLAAMDVLSLGVQGVYGIMKEVIANGGLVYGGNRVTGFDLATEAGYQRPRFADYESSGARGQQAKVTDACSPTLIQWVTRWLAPNSEAGEVPGPGGSLLLGRRAFAAEFIEIPEVGKQQVGGAARALRELHSQWGHPAAGALQALLHQRVPPWWVLRLAGKLGCSACDRCQKRQARPIAAGKLAEPMEVIQIDGFGWAHPVAGVGVRSSPMTGEGNGEALANVRSVIPSGGNAGNAAADETWGVIANDRCRHFGEPIQIRSGREGNCGPRDLQDRATNASTAWDPEPAGARWATRRVEAAVGIVEEAGGCANSLPGSDLSCQGDLELGYARATKAHSEMLNRNGVGPDAILGGRAIRPLGSALRGAARQLEAKSRSGSPAEASVRRRAQAGPSKGPRATRSFDWPDVLGAVLAGVFERGEVVFAWRGPGAECRARAHGLQGCIGPAVFLSHLRDPEDGRHCEFVLLVYRGRALTATPQQQRAASEAEATFREMGVDAARCPSSPSLWPTSCAPSRTCEGRGHRQGQIPACWPSASRHEAPSLHQDTMRFPRLRPAGRPKPRQGPRQLLPTCLRNRYLASGPLAAGASSWGPAAWAAAALRENSEGKLRDVGSRLRERLCEANVWGALSCLASEITERAPRETGGTPVGARWFLTVESDGAAKTRMSVAGWVPMEWGPRLWVLCDGHKIAGISLARVDGMAVGVDEDSVYANQRLNGLKGSRNGGDDGAIQQFFQKAAKKVTKIEGWQKPLKGMLEDELAPAGKTACRAASGGPQYLASQAMSFVAAGTSIAASYLNGAINATFQKISEIVRNAREVQSGNMAVEAAICLRSSCLEILIGQVNLRAAPSKLQKTTATIVMDCKVDVQPYAFTTKSLFVGHLDHNYVRWQVIDTPGILDHPLEDRNTIEMTAITALAHLPAAVLFFVDVSEMCGYPIPIQVALFHSIKPLFRNRPLLICLNKTDLKKLSELSEEDRKLIESMKDVDTDGGNVQFFETSCVTREGVDAARGKACDMLLEKRVGQKLKQGKADTLRNRLHITGTAAPSSRPPCIPAAVLAQRNGEQMAVDADERE